MIHCLEATSQAAPRAGCVSGLVLRHLLLVLLLLSAALALPQELFPRILRRLSVPAFARPRLTTYPTSIAAVRIHVRRALTMSMTPAVIASATIARIVPMNSLLRNDGRVSVGYRGRRWKP